MKIMGLIIIAFAVFQVVTTHCTEKEIDIWQNIKCDEQFQPDNCDFKKIPLITVEDVVRCAPAVVPTYVRNYYFGWGGRGVTYRENRRAFGNIFIKPKVLRDISDNSLDVTTLGQAVSFPVGIAPAALQILADPAGENATATAAAALNTIMILSSYSSIRLEEVAEHVKGSGAHLWMQLHVFENEHFTIDILRRAERSGYKAIVLTVDSYVNPPVFCNASNNPRIADVQLANVPVTFIDLNQALTTTDDIKWLKSITKLPIVIKGILSGDDAVRSIKAGASAIIVSNHGGRLLDGAPATIDALPEVVKAVRDLYPRPDVYLDGGIRNGFDVYKAIARGAKMVFVGRPVLWGLALEGESGVQRVLQILKSELNSTMLLTGTSNPSKINGQGIIPSIAAYQ